MLKNFKMIFVMVLICSIQVFAQLNEMEVKSLPKPTSMPIFPNNPDDAALIFYSSIEELDFQSTTGGIVSVKVEATSGKYIVLVKTEKQIITIKKRGFREKKIRIFGLNAKDVNYYEIIPKTNSTGRFIVNCNERGAVIEVKALGIKNEYVPFQSDNVLAGKYLLSLRKNGFIPIDTAITIRAGKTEIINLNLNSTDLDISDRFAIDNQISVDNELVRNVYFDTKNGDVVLYYDLRGDRDEDYEVVLLIKDKNDPEYVFKPKHLIGDIGEGKYAGLQRRILWNIFNDLPNGLIGNNYYIDLAVEEVGSNWFYYVGGAVVGGVVAVLTLFSSESSSSDSDGQIANPPDRP